MTSSSSSSKQWKCAYCKIAFPSQLVLNTHIEVFHPNPIRHFTPTVPPLGPRPAPTTLRSLARNPNSHFNPVQGSYHFDVDFYRRSLETQGGFRKRPRPASQRSPVTPSQWGAQNSRCGDICPQSAPAPRYKFLLPKVPELMDLFYQKQSEDKRTLPLIRQLEMRRPENTVMEDVGDNMSPIDLELKL